MYTIHGTYCPVPAEGQLVVWTCSGTLDTASRSFPGSFWPGPLFRTEEQATSYRCAVLAQLFEFLAEECLRPEKSVTGLYLQYRQCREAARIVRMGEEDHPLVEDCQRHLSPLAHDYARADIPLPEGAVGE